MRLHSLTLRAIGPYVDEQRVDFDALSRDGLFLFAGPTGAGKSTILDAVTFAIYGALPGARHGLDGKLKSDFAAPDVTPYVELELTIGDRRMKLTRSPEFERPKKRGDGTTRQKSSVALEQWHPESGSGGGWVGVEGGRKEAVVAEWFDEHLRLGLSQFSQVVVLPQGQFAQFLHCKDSERESLLSSLFDADRYRDVEGWFEDKARLERAAVSDVDEQVSMVLARTAEVAGLDEVPDAAGDEWYAGLIDDARSQQAAQQERTAEARERTSAATASLRTAERVAELLAEYAALRQRKQNSEARWDWYNAATLELTGARLVAPFEPLLQQVAERTEREGQAREELETAQVVVQARAPGARLDDLAELKRFGAGLSRKRGGLDDVIALERALGSLESEIEAARAEHDDALQRRTEQQEMRDELPAQLASARERQRVLQTELVLADGARQELDQLREAYAAATEAADLAPALAAAKQAHEDAREQANEAKEEWLQLQQQHLDGMQAQLASRLVAGQACGVCGSCSHPRPAVADFSVPSAKVVDAAKAACGVIEATRDDRALHLQKLQTKQATLDARAGGRSVAELAEARADAERRVSAADEAARLAPDMQQLIDEAEKALAGAEDDLRSADREVSAAQAALQVAQQRLREATEKVAAHRADFATVAEHAADLDQGIESVDAYLAAAQASDAACRERVAIEEQLRSEMVDRGFDDVQDAVRSIRTQQQQAELSDQIRAYEAERSAVRDQLDDSRFADLPSAAPDLAPLQAAYDAAREAEIQSASAVQELESRAAKLAGLRAEAATRRRVAGEAAIRAQRIDELAKLMRGLGPNTKGMSLTSYFLAARLDEVAAVASEHLLRMTLGRYELEHTDERTSKRGRGGLGLQVIDNHTGIARTPKSLSGGETFTASLALALALADVVTAEAGVTSIDSLFIDEGFGALDSDYLDAAMNVLDDLRQVGRTIGVISHVEEMKHRIPSQLIIERAERGSVIRAHA